MTIVRVAFDVPLDTLFDYRCDGATPADIGLRVLAPLGKRAAVGVILEVSDTSQVATARLRHVTHVLRDVPPLPPDVLKLLRFAAAYYHHPLGAVVMSALPTGLKRANRKPAKQAVFYALTEAGANTPVESLPARAATKRRMLALFQARQEMPDARYRERTPTEKLIVKQMVNAGMVAIREGTLTLGPAAGECAPLPTSEPALTPGQASAVATINADLSAYKTHLLLGVTGSGKTEVYLRVIEAVLAQGRQALLLVPEIALTPQLEGTVRGRFPQVKVVSLHSGLNESERLNHWLAAQDGTARIVLGTRLAVFAPMPDLGLIVADEEHDASFKQSEGFRYSARDLAIARARDRGVPVILGSATPALETWQNAATGRYQLTRLPSRINGRPPRIACVDTRAMKGDQGLAPALVAAIRLRLERGEQSLVFINRRGYAPVLLCGECGWLSECRRCTARLVLHLKTRRLHCHHCGAEAPVPVTCPECGNADLTPVGQGTQRIEAALTAHFPTARVLRIDRDTTRAKGAWHGMRGRIQAREVDILVGTQILSKGHDFAGLSLVGVINADSLLYSTDFRAPERLYAMLTQVAGRAGRGDTAGEVLIQTQFPGHPLYMALHDQDYPRFAEALLDERKRAGFPPYCHQALLRAEAVKLEIALTWLTQAAETARNLVDGSDGVTVYDPVPALMMRLAGRERAQLLVQSDNRMRLQRFLAQWRALLAQQKNSTARWAIDVDPLEL